MRIKNYKIQSLMLTVVLSVLFSSAVFSQNGSLKVGAAKAEIKLPVGPDYKPSGNYDHEHLYARAIVLDNGVTHGALLSADISNIPEDVWNSAAPSISKELNCPVENILLSATHTHSGRTPEGKQPEVQLVVDAFLSAVKQAETMMKPAKVGYGTGELYLNVNRDVISKKTRLWTQAANLNAPSDKTLAVVLFTDMNGAPIAGYMNYAMHPVNGYLSGIVSADYPGAACRYIEKAFGDKMTMIFTQGASGDQNPRWLRPGTNVMASETGVKITGYEMTREDVEAPLREGKIPAQKPDPKVVDNLERWMQSLGTIVGEEAIRVMSNIQDLNSDVRIWGAQEILTVPGRKRTNTGREGAPGTYVDGPPVDIRLGMLGIGDIALTTVDAEVYTMIEEQVKKKSPMANTIMVTLTNGRANSGYIITDADYGKTTFQVLGNKIKPGYAEEGIVNGLVDLVEQYDSANKNNLSYK